MDEKTSTKSGERVKVALKEAGIKQVQLAGIVNYHPQYINQIIRGKRNLTVDLAQKIADLTGVRKEYLLCEDDYKTKKEFRRAADNELLFRENGIDELLRYVSNKYTNWDLVIENPETPTNKKYVFNNQDRDAIATIDRREMDRIKDDLIEYAEFLLMKLLMQHTDSSTISDLIADYE